MLKFEISYHRDGTRAPNLINVVLQNFENAQVLFSASMSKKSLRLTMRLREVVLYSRSRKCLWHKGAASGDILYVKEIWVNCENNSLLVKIIPKTGGICHKKDEKGKARKSCYFRKIL
jgi:phosphoribosyl-AMP cyclohydrolase